MQQHRSSTTQPQRYAVVGTGHRAEMYVRALLSSHADVGTPVAWCDTNPVRMAYYDDVFAEYRPGETPPPSYPAEQFETMINDVRPDGLIVTTADHAHSDYVVAGLKHGLRVIVEKPMTTDATKAREIAAAADAAPDLLTTTFNYRYAPRNTVVKDVINSGAIGTPTSVHFEWLLDTGHGADYFRRWHRQKQNSGGLLVHKASHHFDLVNWWLADVPQRVTALGGLRFYGEANARSRGLEPGGATSREMPDPDTNPWAIDIAANDRNRRLYLEAEHVDGYHRDQNVFGSGITIEDTMNVLVGYRGGGQLSYSLYAYAPWEGYRVAINGTEGRAELDVIESPHRARDTEQEIDPSAIAEEQLATAPKPPEEVRKRSSRVLLQRHWERAREIPIPEGKGGHGGADVRLLDDIFRGTGDDPLQHRAGYLDGLRSVAVGIAANQSLQTEQTVPVDSLNLPLT